MNNWKNLI